MYIQLPNPVLSLSNALATLAGNLAPVHATSARRLEEERGTVTLLDHVRQVSSVCCVAVVLQILSARRVRESEWVLDSLHVHRLGRSLRTFGLSWCHLNPALQRVDGIHLFAHDLADGELGVEAGGDCAAELLYRLDGLSAGARDNDVDGCCELVLAASEKFYAVFHAVHAARCVEFAQSDRLGRVEAAGVDPFLDAVQVDRAHVHREAGRPVSAPSTSFHLGGYNLLVHFTSLAIYHNIRRLTTLEAERHLSMLLLTLVTSSRCLALARAGTTTAADNVVVCSLGVGKGGENRRRALLLVQERVEEGRNRLVGWLREASHRRGE